MPSALAKVGSAAFQDAPEVAGEGWVGMKQDIGAVAHKLAEDGRITDYDFWRALKNLDSEIYRISDDHQPIPIEMLRWRVILKQARHRRGRG